MAVTLEIFLDDRRLFIDTLNIVCKKHQATVITEREYNSSTRSTDFCAKLSCEIAGTQKPAPLTTKSLIAGQHIQYTFLFMGHTNVSAFFRVMMDCYSPNNSNSYNSFLVKVPRKTVGALANRGEFAFVEDLRAMLAL